MPVIKLIHIPSNEWGITRVQMLDNKQVSIRTYTPPFEDIRCRLSATPRWFRARVEELLSSPHAASTHGIKINNVLYINID